MTPSVEDAFERMIVNELIIAGEDPENTEKTTHLADTVIWLSKQLLKLLPIMHQKWPSNTLAFARALNDGVGKMLTDFENAAHARNLVEKRERELRPRLKLAAAEGVTLDTPHE